MEHDGGSSPKKFKRRKYAPKACVSCRRAKLKCSGDNPCQRCVDTGKRCFYSEDQTAAEVLQTLSRPTPGLPPHNVPRLPSRPQDGPSEPRASDKDIQMEARMARVEAMLDALMRGRAVVLTPPEGSLERGEPANDGLKSESPFSLIQPDLVELGGQTPEATAAPPTSSFEAPVAVRVGNQMLSFPEPAQYQQYVAQFFGDIHLRYPCVDETIFHAHTERVVTSGLTDPSDHHFLALSYIIFACCDALYVTTASSSSKNAPPGWHWFRSSCSLQAESLYREGDDLFLTQFLFFQALYYTFIDLPAPAYESIRLACTRALQQNLHQQATWLGIDSEETYWRICLFWNIYVVDRSIAISCGRPASFSLEDVNVEEPTDYRLRTGLTLHRDGTDLSIFHGNYLKYMTWSARLANNTAAKMFGARLDGDDEDALESLMDEFARTELPGLGVPQAPAQEAPNSALKTFVTLRPALIPIFVVSRLLASIKLDSSQIKYFGSLVIHVMGTIGGMCNETCMPSSYRHQMTSTVACALLVSSAILLCDVSLPDYDIYIGTFGHSVTLLSELAHGLSYARRVHEDCRNLIELVNDLVNRWQHVTTAKRALQGWGLVTDLRPDDYRKAFPYQTVSPSLSVGDSTPGFLWLF